MHVCMLRIAGGRAIVCMYVTDIRRESYHVFVCYGYQDEELSCVCMLRISGWRDIMYICICVLRISGARVIMCMCVTDIMRESYVCYRYQEAEL